MIYQRQQGNLMIDLIVGIALLAIISISLVGVYAGFHKRSAEAFERSRAIWKANSILEYYSGKEFANITGTFSEEYISSLFPRLNATTVTFRWATASVVSNALQVSIPASQPASSDLKEATVTVSSNNFAGNVTLKTLFGTLDTGPAITGITTSDLPGTYRRKNGSTIQFSVVFDEAVNLVQAAGFEFYINLNIGVLSGAEGSYSVSEAGAGAVRANYVSGSGANTLNFNYDVGTTHTSTDTTDFLGYSPSLVLNNGSLRNGAGVDAVLTLPAVNTFTAERKYLVFLPDISTNIYTQAEQALFNAANSQTVVAQTPQDIFNTWARFDNRNYFSSSSGATGNAATWSYQTSPNRIIQNANTSYGCGFVSPDNLDNYIFEATVTSSDYDDDTIGLIAAFVRNNNANYALVAVRTQGGLDPRNGWGFIYIKYPHGSYQTTFNNVSVGGVFLNSYWETGKGWSGRSSKIKIQRQGDVIRAWCSNWNPPYNYDSGSEISINLNSNSDLVKFKGAKPYGYYTHSQRGSTYLNASMSSGVVAALNFNILVNNSDPDNVTLVELRKAQNGTYQTIAGATLQGHMGYLRKVFRTGGNAFLIMNNKIITYPYGS